MSKTNQSSNQQAIEKAYQSLAKALSGRMLAGDTSVEKHAKGSVPKVVNYLSLEFLMGRSMHNAIMNLDLQKDVKSELEAQALALEELEDCEPDAGLGNGGLGRLAACFLDSCSTLDVPAIGYGIRYRYGMFKQKIEGGRQFEEPDYWLENGAPWEREVLEDTRVVKFYGHCEYHKCADGSLDVNWVDTVDVKAVPHDLPVPGFRNGVVNALRLWRAEPNRDFNLPALNHGDFGNAMKAQVEAEVLSAVLYPEDTTEAGKYLRLRQQYFMVSASLQDVVARWVARNGADFTEFAKANVFQLNDTHPIMAIPELMRILMDDYRIEWNDAWAVVSKSMAFTNHTLLPEALETWPLGMVQHLLPRLADIIREIDVRWLRELDKFGVSDEARRNMAVIGEHHYQQVVRMANLGVVGAFSVNGVAALHTDLLKQGLFNDFFKLYPEKFNNKTNGVTPRRWLYNCNPGLSALITETIGDGWQADLGRLQELKAHANDASFVASFMAVKRDNKSRLAELVKADTGVEFDPSWLFDVQVKRIHEYKRQLLNILHVIHLYDRIQRGDTANFTPRCVLIGGKSAPGYAFAKRIIHLANAVASTVNADPATKDYLRMVFLPNYRVSAMEVICSAADLSEQISTAGKEASGTGNMKFMMNGAVTIGTLDGANIEILEAAGEDNFYKFGLETNEVVTLRRDYRPERFVEADDDLARVINMLEEGVFNAFIDPAGIQDILHAIRSPREPWVTLADFTDYKEAQQRAAECYRDAFAWGQKALLNTATSGRFSSDRTIGQYRDDIWFK